MPAIIRRNRSLLVLSIPLDDGAAVSVTEQPASKLVAIDVLIAVFSSGWLLEILYIRPNSLMTLGMNTTAGAMFSSGEVWYCPCSCGI